MVDPGGPAMKRAGLALLLVLVATGCKPRPCVSPIAGKRLPPRPQERAAKLSTGEPLEKWVEAVALDLGDGTSYWKSLEKILIDLGAIPTPPEAASDPKP